LGVPAGPKFLWSTRRLNQNFEEKSQMLTNTQVSKVQPSCGRRPQRTQEDLDRIHQDIPALCAILFKQKFDRDLEWDKGCSAALSRVLAFNPEWSVDEVKMMVRSYYQSFGIPYALPPFEWLPQLAKYRWGALDSSGVPKSTRDSIEAEVAQRNAEMDAHFKQRELERKASDKVALHSRAIARVTRDLMSKGYEVFRPVGQSSCHLLATSGIPTRWVHALRIVIRLDGEAVVADGRCCQALVRPEVEWSPLSDLPDPNQRHPIQYEPPLPSGAGANKTESTQDGQG
jgi:hypothetical protein